MSGYSGRPMSPIDAQLDLMKSHVSRGVTMSPKRDTDQHTFILAKPPEWMGAAKCAGDMSMLDDAVGLSPGEAMKRCEGCPVVADCLSDAMTREHGLSAGNRYTIRGGLSPKERAVLEVAENQCERGHVGRWADNGRGKQSVCLDCKAEARRETYAVRAARDPEYRAVRAARLREARAIQRVSCLECKAEIRTTDLERHHARTHGRVAA